MMNSKIPYSQEQRESTISMLNSTLANLTDLKSQMKNAHWNTKGILFYELHLLFDRLAGEYDDFIDTIAERIVAMGGVAKGSLRQAVMSSVIQDVEFPGGGLAVVESLIDAVAEVGKANMENIDKSGGINDQVTLNILAEIQQTLDTQIFLLESTTQRIA